MRAPILLVLPLAIVACAPRSAALGDSADDPAGDSGDAPVDAARWVDIEAAATASCALDSEGGVRCWGSPELADAVVPAGPYVAIGVSLGRACGQRVDGTLGCWGLDDPYGGLTPPTGTFERFALGDELACATSADGAYTCWGRTEVVDVPARTDAATFDVGTNGLCELDANGTITCVGYINNSASVEAQAPPVDTYSALSVGEGLACAVRAADGSVVCWGTRAPPTGTEPSGTGYAAVYTGLAGACALDAGGNIACEGTVSPYRDPITLTGPFVDVAAGSEHVCALRADGTIECQGLDDFGQSTPPGAPEAG